ncbi:MAG: hypothetical protein H6740_24210 [Alphaproteobacteria bacterium]|nr:hypothetical protein [Alphaproteobacteria bacterium]
MPRTTLLALALLGACIGAPSDPTDTGTLADSEAPVATGPIFCTLLAPRSGRLAVIDVEMATGSWQQVGAYNVGSTEAAHTNGLAKLGDVLVASVYTVGLVEIDTALGTANAYGGDGPGSIASDGSALYTAYDSADLARYPDVAALAAGTPDLVLNRPFNASRYAAADGELFGAWHSTDEVDVVDSGTGAHLRTLSLEDWDTWVQGMSVVDDTLYLVDDERSDNYSGRGVRIAAYDKQTGTLQANVFLPGVNSQAGYSHKPSGLWCEHR